jgi:CRP-like cAMP-binding protein
MPRAADNLSGRVCILNETAQFSTGGAMSSILELIHSNDVRHFNAGEVIIEQGAKTNLLWFLVEGAVEIVKAGVCLATAAQPGAVFGELSALLGGNHTATVRAL